MGRAIFARRGGALGAALVLGALASLLWVSTASADIEFCPAGAGAGQCGATNFDSRGVAIDEETGHVYVADNNNNRIEAFDEGGSFLFAFGWGVKTGAAQLETCTEASECKIGLAGGGLGQFEHPTQVAVDNGPGSSTEHDIYVVDAKFRVQKFHLNGETAEFVCSIGSQGEGEGQFAERDVLIDVGPGGVLHALDNLRIGGGVETEHRLQRFKATPPCETALPQCILFEGGFANGLAAEAGGDLWVSNQGTGQGIRKYSPACAKTAGPFDTELRPNGIALDEAGDLFALQTESRDKALGSFQVIAAHDAAGSILARFGYGRVGSLPDGFAARSGGEGGIFLAQGLFASQGLKGMKRLNFPPAPTTLPSPGPIAAPPSLEVKELGSTKAKLLAEVNPEGEATEAHFEYLTEDEYNAQGESFEGPATKKTPATALGESFHLKSLEAPIGCPDPANEAGAPGNNCLAPETVYRWRVVAVNADNPSGAGEASAESSFETAKSIEFGGAVWATKVGADTARLNGEVDPNSIPATGHFEYVEEATYQADIEKAEEEGRSPEEVAEAGFDHAVKAPDEGKGQAPLDFGAGEVLTTRGISIYPLEPGTSYRYRLVADNPLIEPKASEEAELRTFALPEAEPCANDAARLGAGALLPDCRAYEMVSPDDKEGGDIRVLRNSLGKLAVLEQSSASGEKLAYGSARSFGASASAPFTSQYIAKRIAGQEWQTHPINPERGRPVIGAAQQFETEFEGFSEDLCEAWQATFAEPPLAPGGVAEAGNLYRRTDQLCSEDGAAHYEWLGSSPGLRGFSADGKHAIFVSKDGLAEGGSEGVAQLYEHVRGQGARFPCVLPGGAPVGGTCTAGGTSVVVNQSSQGADPNGAISDDSRVIFWSTPSGEGEIYARIEGTQTTAVSEAAEAAEGTSGSWFWGSANDGSKAILSTGLLPSFGGGGSIGDSKAALFSFELEGAVTHPIAAGVGGVMGMSESADRIYFASKEVLSGAEENSNGDKAQAGKANLYLHEVGEAGESTKFVATLAGADLVADISKQSFGERSSRVSPDGAHAAFGSVAPLTGYDNKRASDGVPTREIYRYDAETEELSCVSCNPTGARPAGPSSIPFLQTSLHGARVLAEDGSRLFFESADALAARDTDGVLDVYQWEEPGTGGCEEEGASFSAEAGGCIDLISSGQSPQDSRFVESDPTGEDVFFATGSSLLPQDSGVFDIYDARVGGGLPVPPPRAPECEGDACHAQVPAPEEPTPASSGYTPPPPASGEGKKPGKKRGCAKGKRAKGGKDKARCAKRKHGRAAR